MSKKRSLKSIFADISDKSFSAKLNAARLLGTISAKIINKRVSMDLNQKEFAEFLNINQSMVSKYESGNYNFSIQSLCKLCAQLDLNVDINITDQNVTNQSLADVYQFPQSKSGNWLNLMDNQSPSFDLLTITEAS